MKLRHVILAILAGFVFFTACTKEEDPKAKAKEEAMHRLAKLQEQMGELEKNIKESESKDPGLKMALKQNKELLESRIENLKLSAGISDADTKPAGGGGH